MRGKWESLDFLTLLNEVKEEIANIFKKLFYKEKQTIYIERVKKYLLVYSGLYQFLHV